MRLFIVLFTIAFTLAVLGFTVYGLYLAFSASILLGILTLIVEPSPLVFGIAMAFWKINLPVMLMAWINAHG